ncbi:helix-turn-helix domain-containing protein [Conexibacter arvalis]|uniref:DNA-binding transcriptional ArsR family regulator n=1 Tax=Conexibacter arvalis TaxID=912552 RepID=A0A840IJQ4_9ACTN|nr:DNA-binding transcriptional ArsR family regulator [Conexibacter arvalis]
MSTARLAISPLRRTLLERLREPASATELAGELGLGRQRVNYHLRELERAGLVELVEERRRRGCVERVLQAREATSDRDAAEHLIVAAADLVRDVSRMQEAAAAAGRRLLTFTLESEVRLAEPADVSRLGDALAAAVGEVLARFDAPAGRSYRIVAGGHPAPARGEAEG